MKPDLLLKAACGLAMLSAPASVLARQLGGGGSPEVPIVRIVGALILSLVVALLAILYLKHRAGGGTPPFLRRLVQSEPQIEVREVRRLTVQHSVGLIRHGGEDYLLLLTPGDGRVLNRRPADSGASEEARR